MVLRISVAIYQPEDKASAELEKRQFCSLEGGQLNSSVDLKYSHSADGYRGNMNWLMTVCLCAFSLLLPWHLVEQINITSSAWRLLREFSLYIGFIHLRCSLRGFSIINILIPEICEQVSHSFPVITALVPRLKSDSAGDFK